VPRSRHRLSADPERSAVAAGLRYVHDYSPGFLRRRSGAGWRYLDTSGRTIREPAILKRIRSLVIPPAWKRVWICASAQGHLQAVGYDQKGRKQYRYHPDYSAIRNETKFGRLAEFARSLPEIRKKVTADLALAGLQREKVLATLVKLLEATYIRVGNEAYAKQNKSFGLTTLKNKHVIVEGAAVKFSFRGKSGQEHEIEIRDRRVARIVRNCQELPGHELFQYLDSEGNRHSIHSEDVNGYIREASGIDFSAKDFRTWGGTLLAVQTLTEMGPAESESELKRNVVAMVKAVASDLGNRPATCRKYYIHPVVIDAYNDGRLFRCVKAGEPPDEECVLKIVQELAA
jgi:DNA topoisomerase I